MVNLLTAANLHAVSAEIQFIWSHFWQTDEYPSPVFTLFLMRVGALPT